jgi:hypothetical protein
LDKYFSIIDKNKNPEHCCVGYHTRFFTENLCRIAKRQRQAVVRGRGGGRSQMRKWMTTATAVGIPISIHATAALMSRTSWVGVTPASAIMERRAEAGVVPPILTRASVAARPSSIMIVGRGRGVATKAAAAGRTVWALSDPIAGRAAWALSDLAAERAVSALSDPTLQRVVSALNDPAAETGGKLTGPGISLRLTSPRTEVSLQVEFFGFHLVFTSVFL